MIEFKNKFDTLKLVIAGEERECEIKKINDLMRADFQTRLLQQDTLTLNALQQNEAKPNLQVLFKKDLFVFAYCVRSIAGFEEWQSWDVDKKIKWLENWIDSDDKEFKRAFEELKNYLNEDLI